MPCLHNAYNFATNLLHIVHAQQHQQPTAATTHTVIHNCCDLGFRQSTFSDIVNKPKQYKMRNMCRSISFICMCMQG